MGKGREGERGERKRLWDEREVERGRDDEIER